MKVQGPLMSMEARGKIGERLVFSKRKSGQQARFQKAQKDVITPLRITQRENYNIALAQWRYLTEIGKESYNSRAVGLHMSGYNLFMKEKILAMKNTTFHIIDAYIEFLGGDEYDLVLTFSAPVFADGIGDLAMYVDDDLYLGDFYYDSQSGRKVIVRCGGVQISPNNQIALDYSNTSGAFVEESIETPCDNFIRFPVRNLI